MLELGFVWFPPIVLICPVLSLCFACHTLLITLLSNHVPSLFWSLLSPAVPCFDIDPLCICIPVLSVLLVVCHIIIIIIYVLVFQLVLVPCFMPVCHLSLLLPQSISLK